MSAQIYAFANQKGGVGKSTTTIHVGIGLSRKGKKVLLIDSDPQANSTAFFFPEYEDFKEDETLYSTLIDKKPLHTRPTRYPGLDLVASHLSLSSADIELTVQRGYTHDRISRQLASLRDVYDIILIDCPPALSTIAINDFCAADRLVVIVEPDKFSRQGIRQLSKTIDELIEGEYDHRIDLRGFLINKGVKEELSFQRTISQLTDIFGDLVYKSFLPYRVEVKNALDDNQSMYERKLGDKHKYLIGLNNFIFEEFGL
jgi:chromosome partitioning protein